jgi:uncharacterized membrane protein
MDACLDTNLLGASNESWLNTDCRLKSSSSSSSSSPSSSSRGDLRVVDADDATDDPLQWTPSELVKLREASIPTSYWSANQTTHQRNHHQHHYFGKKKNG